MRNYFVLVYFILISGYALPQQWEWGQVLPDKHRISHFQADKYQNLFCLSYSLPTNDNTLQYAKFQLTKFSPTGNILWSKAIGYKPYLMTVSETGEIYLASNYGPFTYEGDTVKTDSAMLICKGVYDFYIVKINGNGIETWAKSYGDIPQEQLSDIRVSGQDLFLSGSFYKKDLCDSLNFGDLVSLKNQTDGPLMFLAKLDNNGQCIWATSGETMTTDNDFDYNARFISFDKYGTLFVLAYSTTGSGLRLKEYLANGTCIRRTDILNSNSDLTSIAVYDRNTLYTISYTSGSGGGNTSTYSYLSRIDSTGKVLWNKRAITESNLVDCQYAEVFGLTTDYVGNVYSCGFFGCQSASSSGQTFLYDSLLTYKGFLDAAWAKISTSGTIEQIHVLASTGEEAFGALWINQDNSIYLSGSLNTKDTDGLIAGSDTLKTVGIVNSSFVVKFNPSLKTSNVEFKKNVFEIFPNPSQGIFTINMLNEQVQIAIYNINGKRIYSNTASYPYSIINLSNQPNGVYFLEITDGVNFSHHKIVITK